MQSRKYLTKFRFTGTLTIYGSCNSKANARFTASVYLQFFELVVVAKRKNPYFHCSNLLAISLCNGESVRHCLAPCILDFIVHGERSCHLCIDDIQDHEIKITLQKMHYINMFFNCILSIFTTDYNSMRNFVIIHVDFSK